MRLPYRVRVMLFSRVYCVVAVLAGAYVHTRNGFLLADLCLFSLVKMGVESAIRVYELARRNVMQLKSTIYFPETGSEYYNLRRITPAGLQKTLKRLVRRAYKDGAKILLEKDRALAVYPHWELFWQVM